MRRAMIITSLALGLALSACAAPTSTTTTTGPTAPVVITTTTTGPTAPVIITTSQPIAPTGTGAPHGTGVQGTQGAGMGQGSGVAQNNQGTGMGQGNQGNQGNGGQGTGMGQGGQGNGGQGNGGQGNGGQGMGMGQGGQPAAPTTALPTDLPATPCLICDTDLSQYTGPLSAAEIDGLRLALNDEYHAWAVYHQVVADFGEVRPFANIIPSEASHISILEALFRTYGVPLPAENPWLSQAPRFASVNEACTVGVDAEIVNVNLYTRLFTSTSRTDILQVYELLQAASHDNHLPAFQRCA